MESSCKAVKEPVELPSLWVIKSCSSWSFMASVHECSVWRQRCTLFSISSALSAPKIPLCSQAAVPCQTQPAGKAREAFRHAMPLAKVSFCQNLLHSMRLRCIDAKMQQSSLQMIPAVSFNLRVSQQFALTAFAASSILILPFAAHVQSALPQSFSLLSFSHLPPYKTLTERRPVMTHIEKHCSERSLGILRLSALLATSLRRCVHEVHSRSKRVSCAA